MAREHIVKCWPDYFGAIERGEKKFDVRRDDRGYQKGDTLVLKKFDPKIGGYMLGERNVSESSASSCSKRIRYVLTGGQFGIEPGYVVLGF